MSAAGEKIRGSIREARAVLRGRGAAPVGDPRARGGRPRAICHRLGLPQAQLAAAFGLELDAIRNREQRRHRPEGAARACLKVLEREPEAGRRARLT